MAVERSEFIGHELEAFATRSMFDRLNKEQNRLLCQVWETCENDKNRGMKSYSLHPTSEAVQRFEDHYSAKLTDEAPSSYRRRLGEPFLATVHEPICNHVHKSMIGMWYYGNEPNRTMDVVNQIDLSSLVVCEPMEPSYWRHG